jgi:putative ABC transport system permease protein
MVFLRTLKSGFRHLLSQKLNSTLHIAGLSLGMTVCLLIGLFIRFELSFDNYHPEAKRIYRINEAWKNKDEVQKHYSTPIAMVAALRESMPAIEHVALFIPVHQRIVDVSPGVRFNEKNVMITDPEFLNIFPLETVKGDARATLSKPYQALLTESTAKKYYGDEDPLGKSFRFNSKFDITVGGIIRDMPANSHLQASMILSYVADEKFIGADPNTWNYTMGSATYVVLPDNFDKNILVTHLQKLADDKINSEPGLPGFIRAGYELVPLSEIHFNAEANGSFAVPAVNRSWIWFFGVVGIAVLALACINFVNLSTAQALTRFKEVGIRKSIGAGRTNLIFQFLGEAWMLAFTSGILAIGFAQFALPYLNDLVEKGIQFDLLKSPGLLLYLTIGIFSVGLLAGLYPAWVITRHSPATSLKSNFTIQGTSSSSLLRRSLVVVQFAVSAGLLIALMLVSNQVEFVHNKDLGFNKDNVVMVKMAKDGESVIFRNELEKIPQVKGVTFSSSGPSDGGHWGTEMSLNGRDDPARRSVTIIMGDDNFYKLYDFTLLAGRYTVTADTSFRSQTLPVEKRISYCVINEEAMKVLGVDKPEDAIGKRFWSGMGNATQEVVGVVKNFNTLSLHEAIKPVLIQPYPSVYGVAGIKLVPGANVHDTMDAVETAWKSVYPDGVFSYQFLDDQINSFYQSEERIFSLFKIFSGIAMLISCLGLWGLITFIAQRRMKEISIRKVLGATTSSIVTLLSSDFIKMVLIALVVATPLVYYGIQQWLNEFAFRAPIGWTTFAIAGVITTALALITVGIQALRATFVNPASTLKSE